MVELHSWRNVNCVLLIFLDLWINLVDLRKNESSMQNQLQNEKPIIFR